MKKQVAIVVGERGKKTNIVVIVARTPMAMTKMKFKHHKRKAGVSKKIGAPSPKVADGGVELIKCSGIFHSNESDDHSIECDDGFFNRFLDMVPVKMYVKQNHEADGAASEAPTVPKEVLQEQKAARFSANPKLNSARIAEQLKVQFEIDAVKMKKLEEESGFTKQAPAKNIQELRERLAKRLQEFQGGRGGDKSKRMSKAQLKEEKKKNKKQNKKSKLDEKQQQGEEQQEKDEERGSDSGGSMSEEDHEKMLREKVAASISTNSPERVAKEKISFGAIIDDDEEENDKKHKKDKKKKLGKRNPLNIKRMLQQAEENKAIMNELKQSVRPEDRQLAKDKAWDELEKKAVGEKVLEPKALRKQLKNIEKKKKKSQEAWKERMDSVEKGKTERFEKRKANIESAQKKKVENKLKRKGIVLEKNEEQKETSRKKKRAGFEGKHDTLNK